MDWTGGELTALIDLHTERREYEYLLAARLALFCRRTIWSNETLNEYDVLGWEQPEPENVSRETPTAVSTAEQAAIDLFCAQYAMQAEMEKQAH